MNTTKQAIAESLKRQLLKKPFHKITISDITEGCGINRMTFYYHFKDIYDLAGWVIRSEADEVLSRREEFPGWQDAYRALLEKIRESRENQLLTITAFRSMEEEFIEQLLLDTMERLLMVVVEEASAGLNVSPEDQHRVADFYKFAFLGVTMEWVFSGMQEEPAQVTETVGRIMDGNFRRALENLSQ